MVYSGCWNGIGIVGGGMILAIVLVQFVRKLFPRAVLLGLIVVDAMTRFERAIDCVQGEANCLADIFLLAGRLPDPQRTRIHDPCRTYAEQVLHSLLTALSALVICLNLYLLSLFGYPFAGELSVSNRPFRLELGIFEGLIREGPGSDVLPLDIPADHG